MQVIAGETHRPIKAWIDGVELEEQARAQLLNVARLPFIHKHVAVMPDVHWGMGATVGSVIPTVGAIVPAAVGVDLGCGMMAVPLGYDVNDLHQLGTIRSNLEAEIPHGRTDNGGPNDHGAWREIPDDVASQWRELASGYDALVAKHPRLARANAARHLGTLGTGNHFVEVCHDETGQVWVMLHSGSRGIGNAIGTYFIERAKRHMERYFVHLPDADLAYLPDGTDDFRDYVQAVEWAQTFAWWNRVLMMFRACAAVTAGVRGAPEWRLENGMAMVQHILSTAAVNCHHNYIAKENHYGANVWVTRKGAVRAREGDLGIIPGSMGAKSFIVRGKGNPESFHSCSHGAGRRMSRGEAKRRISLEQHVAATAGVECRKDADVIDESPAAYKDIDAVMAAQADLVDVVHTLRQVVCVKG